MPSTILPSFDLYKSRIRNGGEEDFRSGLRSLVRSSLLAKINGASAKKENYDDDDDYCGQQGGSVPELLMLEAPRGTMRQRQDGCSCWAWMFLFLFVLMFVLSGAWGAWLMVPDTEHKHKEKIARKLGGLHKQVMDGVKTTVASYQEGLQLADAKYKKGASTRNTEDAGGGTEDKSAAALVALGALGATEAAKATAQGPGAAEGLHTIEGIQASPLTDADDTAKYEAAKQVLEAPTMSKTEQVKKLLQNLVLAEPKNGTVSELLFDQFSMHPNTLRSPPPSPPPPSPPPPPPIPIELTMMYNLLQGHPPPSVFQTMLDSLERLKARRGVGGAVSNLLAAQGRGDNKTEPVPTAISNVNYEKFFDGEDRAATTETTTEAAQPEQPKPAPVAKKRDLPVDFDIETSPLTSKTKRTKAASKSSSTSAKGKGTKSSKSKSMFG